MAIEDEIINISDIDIGTEILNSDKLLIETSNGTKMIAFKDFVVGPDNISSVRQNQIEGNVEGEADTFYNVVTGFNILNNQTTPGLNTQYDQISGTVELGKFNYNAIANLAAVSADILTNASAVDELRLVLDHLSGVLENTNNDVLKSVTLTTSACNCIVRGAFLDSVKHGKRNLAFTTAELDPSTTNPNCTIQLNPFKITFPDANEGFVDGSRFMIIANFEGTKTGTGGGGRTSSGQFVMYRDKADGSSEQIMVAHGTETGRSQRGGPYSRHYFTIMHTAVVRINFGDSLRFRFPYGNPSSGSLDIFKIA